MSTPSDKLGPREPSECKWHPTGRCPWLNRPHHNWLGLASSQHRPAVTTKSQHYNKHTDKSTDLYLCHLFLKILFKILNNTISNMKKNYCNKTVQVHFTIQPILRTVTCPDGRTVLLLLCSHRERGCWLAWALLSMQ